MKRKISNKGIEFIKKHEGCRLTACKADKSEKYYTIGYGHYSSDIVKGMKITQEKAEEYLKKDIARFEKAVNDINELGMYGFGQAKFDALVSFAYNLGQGTLIQLTANGTRSDRVIYEKMLQYNKCGGKVLKGLVKRREDERKLFANGLYE